MRTDAEFTGANGPQAEQQADAACTLPHFIGLVSTGLWEDLSLYTVEGKLDPGGTEAA